MDIYLPYFVLVEDVSSSLVSSLNTTLNFGFLGIFKHGTALVFKTGFEELKSKINKNCG